MDRERGVRGRGSRGRYVDLRVRRVRTWIRVVTLGLHATSGTMNVTFLGLGTISSASTDSSLPDLGDAIT
jgi:hypothetical protein